MELVNTFSKNYEVSNFMKALRVGTDFFHADEKRDKQTDKHRVVSFRNFGNQPKHAKVLFNTYLYATEVYSSI
jgi:hypothetical protein